MKKKQLVAVFVMMLAAATMATACGGSSDPKAKDALKYLDEKYSDEQVINIGWSDKNYDNATYNFLQDFTVKNGFEMEVYADEALTDLQDQEGLELVEGNNDFWIVVFKEGKDKDHKSAHTFKVNVYKPVTVNVTLNVEGVETELEDVYEENSFIPAPAAPTLPKQKKFVGWYMDPSFNVAYTPTERDEDFTLYAKIEDNDWTTNVKIKLENVNNSEYSDGEDVEWGFKGEADKSEFTHTIDGFVLDKFEANGDDVTAHYVRETYTVSFVNEANEPILTPVTGVKYGAVPDLDGIVTTKDDNGETYYTFDKWVNLDNSDVGAISGNVTLKPTFTENTYSYKVIEEIEGATFTITNPQQTYAKGESVSFTIALEADYNRSADYTILVNGEAVEAVENVYTFEVLGGTKGADIVITAEGIEQNTYEVGVSAYVVNKDADFAIIESETDVVLKVNDEIVDYTDLANIKLSLKSGEHKIEFVVNDVVYHTENVVIEAGQEDVALDDVYLGYFDMEGLTNTADGQINGLKQKIAFFNDLPQDVETFRASYTVQNDWDRMPEDVEREPSPGYGWAFEMGNNTYLNVMLLDNNIMIAYDGMKNGWDPIFTGHAFSAQSIYEATNGAGLKLDLMKKGDALYFYIDGNMEFVLTEEGFISVTTDVTLTDAQNAIIGEKVAKIISTETLKVGQYVTMGGEKYVPYLLTNASFTTDADVIATYNEYGSVEIAIDKSDATLRQATASVYVGDLNVVDGANAMKGVNIDLNDYFMIGKDVTVVFGRFFQPKDVESLVIYTTKEGVTDEGVDVTDKVVYVDNENYKYTFTPEKGASYKFEVKVKAKEGRYNSKFAIVTEDGALANGIEFNVYKANGNLVYTSVTSTVEDYNGSIDLPAGEYYIEVLTSGNIFGKVQEFIVVDQPVLVEVELAQNIWGTNWTGVTSENCKIEYSVDSSAEDVASTFKVTRSGYHNGAWEKYNLGEKLGDGEIISYTMKFEDGHALYMGLKAGDLYAGEDTYLRPDVAPDFVGAPSDMYFWNEVGGKQMGLSSKGAGIGNGAKIYNPPTFSIKGIEGAYIDMTDPDRYDIEYNIMYARVDGKVYMFAKLATDEEYTLVSESNFAFGDEELAISLIYSARGGHQLNITYKDFDLKKDAQEDIKLMVEKLIVGDCLFNGTSGTATVNGDGELVSLTGGTITHEQNGDFILWDTSTIGDVTDGKFFIEGNFTAWGGYNANNEWKRHQGAGFVLKQMATGKMITIEPSYQTNSELLIQVSEGNGWNTRATLGAINAPTGVNAISFQTEAVASKANPAKYYMRAEVEGYVWKIWIGKDESTIDFSKPTWEVDMYAHLSTAPGGHGSGSQWSGNSNAAKNREPRFPFIADTADGKYKAEGSDAWSAGNVCMGYVSFGDAGTAGGTIISNGSINYVSNADITAIAKNEATEEIESYATSLNFELTDVELAPINNMVSYKAKAEAIEEAKALIFFADYKADAIANVLAYAATNGVELSAEEDAYIKALISDSATKDEVDANTAKAIALIDAEKENDGSILGITAKVAEAKNYVADAIASTKEKGITDYAKNMLDAFEVQAITYLDALYNIETIDEDIATGKQWTDQICEAVQQKFTVSILDAKGEVAEEIKDVLFGTEVASLLEGKVASAKEDDKGGLGEYVFKSWSYETEDGVVGSNLEITPEYTYNYYNLTISGSAVDDKGNAIAGASVVITNAEGATYEGVTDESGAYSIEASLGDISVEISKAGYLARTTAVTNGVDKKDGEIAIGVMAIANGVIEHSAEKAMKASYEYTDDLASAVVNNLQLDFASASSGFVYETADVLDKNTYYKFTTKFNGASEGKLAHGINVNTNKYYTTVKKTLTGSNAGAGTTVGQVVDNYIFADVAFKMGVGGTFDQGGHTVKVNGQGGEAMTSDKRFYGYSSQASIPADRQFNIVNDSPFEAFYEKAYRTFVEDTSKYNPNYDIEYDMMYVKDAEGKVKLYGRLGGSVHGWVLMAESKTAIAGKNLIIAQSTRSNEWYINETVKNIESGAIDVETGLPAGEKIDEYLYNTDNASVVRDAEGKETYVLDLTGYAEVTNDGWNQLARGGNGQFAKAYSIKDSYDYLNDGILTLEGKFNAQDGHTGGALTGFYIQDANETGRFYYLGVKSNGGVGLAFANGNGSGWRIFHLQNKACEYFSINKDKLPTWNNGNAKDFYLKGVFEGNKISYYISTEGMPEATEENWLFTVTDLVKLVETQFDTLNNAASAIANRMPNSAVNAGIYFNHEGGRGIDRVVVTDFKATYKTSADLLNDAKAEAKKELAIYAESKGVAVVEAMTSKIDAVTSIDGISSALDAAKQVVDFFASHPEDAEGLLAIVDNAITEIDTAYAGVDKDTLTAKGIEDLDATVAESKATINAIDSVDGAQATADGAVKAVKDKIAQVTGEVVVAFGDNEVTVKYGTLISSIDVSTFTAPTKEDDKGGIGTYEFDKWAVADDAVATAEVTNVEAEFIYNYYAVTISGTAVDYAGAKLAGVEVSIKHESGAVYTGVTDENGAYSIEVLLGASDITWSTPEILDTASRFADINKTYVYARTAKIDADVSVKDAVKTVDVALAYGWSSSNKTVVASGTYSDDLSDASVEGLSYDVNGYILNPAFRTGAVLKENTYYKFTVNFHDGSDGNPAHNIHNSGKYTNASNQFADIGLKMIVGKKAIKINGNNGNVLACDQWCQDYVTDAADANATSQFSRTTTNPFSGLFENSFRGAGSIGRVLADYDKPDMDIMYVKTTDNHVDIYGKLTNSDSDWVKLGDGTVAGDWITFTMGTRSGEFAHNWTLEGIEYGAIDTETNLPAGAKVDAYTFTATNASAAWDNETNGYEYELNISGNGNCASDTGGDGTYGLIYDNSKTYKFGTGRLVVEGDFTVVQGRAGGAAFGITLRDSASTSRKLSVLMRSNGKQVIFGLNDGNCNGARTWNGLDKLKSNANSTVYNTDMVKEWHSAQEKNIHLKYVFDNNTLTVYYDGIKFFSVENLTEFIKTALDANAAEGYNNKYPTSDVYVGMYFNHENGFGTDRARVKNFKVTYNTDDELVAKVKTDATAEVNEYAASLNTEATEADLAPITSYAHKVGADYDEEALAIVNASKLSVAKRYAKAQLSAYADENGFTKLDGGIAIIDAMVDYNKLEEVIVEAKAKVDYDNNEGARLAVEALKTQALADIDAVVAESGVTAYGQTYLDNAKATAKATVNGITTLDEAEASEIIEGALKVATDAKAVVDSNVSLTFYGNDAQEVRYGALVADNLDGVKLVNMSTDAGYTYATAWDYAEGAVVTTDTTINPKGVFTANGLSGENGALTATCGNENGNFNVNEHMIYTKTVGDAENGVFEAEGFLTVKYNGKTHQGGGIRITQLSTGKVITFALGNNKTNSTELMASVNPTGDGWDGRIILNASNVDAYNVPTGENAIAFTADGSEVTYYVRAEVDGYSIKLWYGKDASTIDLNNPTFYIKDIYSKFRDLTNGHGGGYVWSDEGVKKFPLYAGETSDGKYQGTGSDIAIGFTAFYHGGGTDNQTTLTNGKITYTANTDSVEKVNAIKTTALNTANGIEVADTTAYGASEFNTAKADALADIEAIATLDEATAQAEADAILASLNAVKTKVEANIAVTFEGNDALSVKYGTVLSSIDTASLIVPEKEADAYSYNVFTGWATSDANVVEEVSVKANFENKTSYALTGKAVDERGNVLSGVSVKAVVAGKEGDVIAETTTAEDGSFSFDVAVGTSTSITFAKKFHFGKAISYTDKKTATTALDNAVMPWTFALDGNGGELAIDGNTLNANDLASTIDTSKLSYNYYGEKRYNQWLDTNLAVGEAITLSFKWNERQQSDRDPNMKFKYGNVDNLGISSMGTGKSNWDSSANNTLFDFGGPKDITINNFTGKVYDYAFVREEGTLKMYGKHGGGAGWVLMATENIAATNTGTTFCFGYSTSAQLTYDFSIFNAKKVAPSEVTGNIGTYIGGSWGSGMKLVDGSYALWGTFANEGAETGSSTRFSGATNSSKVYTPEKYDMTTNRVVVESDLMLGTDHPHQTSGLLISNGTNQFVLGFKENKIAMQFGITNGWTQRCWNVTSSLKGVNYYNQQALEQVGLWQGNFQSASFHAKWEIEGTDVNVYVDDVLAFSADYEVLMTNYTTNNENSAYANTSSKIPTKSTAVQFGYLANHETYIYSNAYAANHFKVTPVAIATDNTQAIADAKASAIAKINAIDTAKLSPAGKEYYDANKATAIEAINAYEAVEGASLTATIGAIEKIAAPVLLTNKDYDVMIAGYGTVSAKWGTVIDTLVEGKTASSFGDSSGYYYNTDGKFAYTAGSKITGYTRIYPSVVDGRKIGGASAITMTDSGNGRGYMTGETPQYLTGKAYDLNKGTLTMRATYSVWADKNGKPQGVGFQLIQPSTGKILKIATNYNTTSAPMISARNTNDGWGLRVNAPAAKNAVTHSVAFYQADYATVATTFGARELDFQMQVVNGKTVKIWIGAVNATFDDSNVNYVIDDIYSYYTGYTGALQGTCTLDDLKNATPNFADDGNVIVGVPFFHDNNGKVQVRNLSVKQA